MLFIIPCKLRLALGGDGGLWLVMQVATFILLLEEILHHLGCINPYQYWDIYYINFCRIYSINSMFFSFMDSWSTFLLETYGHFPRSKLKVTEY